MARTQASKETAFNPFGSPKYTPSTVEKVSAQYPEQGVQYAGHSKIFTGTTLKSQITNVRYAWYLAPVAGGDQLIQRLRYLTHNFVCTSVLIQTNQQNLTGNFLRIYDTNTTPGGELRLDFLCINVFSQTDNYFIFPTPLVFYQKFINLFPNYASAGTHVRIQMFGFDEEK